MTTHPTLHRFLQSVTELVARAPADLPEQAQVLMQNLVAQDAWLPDAMAEPHPQHYQQHLLYLDPAERFSLVSFVWGPGQATPIHDHTTWGVIGMLRGAEIDQAYRWEDDRLVPGDTHRLSPGNTAIVSPQHGDIHAVRNGLDDQVSISIHLYGGNIGAIERHVFDADTGAVKPFISGYSKTLELML